MTGLFSIEFLPAAQRLAIIEVWVQVHETFYQSRSDMVIGYFVWSRGGGGGKTFLFSPWILGY